MAQSQAAAPSDDDSDQSPRGARPVKTFKQGGVEVSVWKNSGEQGDMPTGSQPLFESPRFSRAKK